ncbi:hypothetical protein [Bradyrhizobium sp. DASA03007]|uniref:hypothetical protein n=1 Tax=unclassified Bradyrhizobium TaxID=2631580 RepID=UPI003F712DF2
MSDKKLSYDEVLTTLNAIKKENEKYEERTRAALYQSLQQSTAVAVLVEAHEDIKGRFCKEMSEEDVLRAALNFVFVPKSLAAKKEVSKRFSALRHLLECLNVEVEGIATAIQKHGGIERLARMAAKHRQGQDGQNEDDEGEQEDRDEPEDAEKKGKLDAKFGRLISVGLSPKLTKRLDRFADQTRIKMIGYVRASQDETPTIELKKIIRLVAKQKGNSKVKGPGLRREEDERDWTD